MARIDLIDVLQRSISASYQDLVTRPTGRAVRGTIEELLSGESGDQVAVIDFGAVGCLDISCADEIVARLLLAHGSARFFILRGLTPDHVDAIDAVLERHGLAVVATDRTGRVQLLGPVSDAVRRTFTFLVERGAAAEDEVVEHLADSLDEVRSALAELRERRLVVFTGPRYQPLTAG